MPPTQTSLLKGHWVNHELVSSVADGSSITFLSPGTEIFCRPCWNNPRGEPRAKVTKADGANLSTCRREGWSCEQFPTQPVQTSRRFSERKASHPGYWNLCVPCLSGNPLKLWPLGKRFSAHRCSATFTRTPRKKWTLWILRQRNVGLTARYSDIFIIMTERHIYDRATTYLFTAAYLWPSVSCWVMHTWKLFWIEAATSSVWWPPARKRGENASWMVNEAKNKIFSVCVRDFHHEYSTYISTRNVPLHHVFTGKK